MGRLAIRAMCCQVGAPSPLIQRLQGYMDKGKSNARGLPPTVD